MRGLFLASLISIACATAWSARAQSASTYQMSCSNIQIAGSTLSASCRRNNGSFDNTSILVRGIENVNGVLQSNGLVQASTFQNSCTDIGVAGSTLSANCRRLDGSFNRTSILIPGIENSNGVLRYP